VIFLGQLLISWMATMGRRNTKLVVYLLESQSVKSFVSFESDGTLSWLGSD